MKSSTLIYSSIKSSNKLNKFEIWKICWAHMSAYCPWSFTYFINVCQFLSRLQTNFMDNPRNTCTLHGLSKGVFIIRKVSYFEATQLRNIALQYSVSDSEHFSQCCSSPWKIFYPKFFKDPILSQPSALIITFSNLRLQGIAVQGRDS
jgi:hypothetical protein